jgi:hypothetical protein
MKWSAWTTSVSAEVSRFTIPFIVNIPDFDRGGFA